MTGCGEAGVPSAAGEPIECALGGSATFARHCGVESRKEGETVYLTLHHPDGGFRRLEMAVNGSGLRAADGADGAAISLQGEGIEVAIAGDRYRLPPRIGGHVGE